MTTPSGPVEPRPSEPSAAPVRVTPGGGPRKSSIDSICCPRIEINAVSLHHAMNSLPSAESRRVVSGGAPREHLLPAGRQAGASRLGLSLLTDDAFAGKISFITSR